MKYSEISTPQVLLEYMIQNMQYGFVDENNQIYRPESEEFQNYVKTKWHLSSPDRLLQVGYGTCFDMVELERDWFSKHGYHFKTMFIWFQLPYNNTYSMHTYLLYEENEKWNYFEVSDMSQRGIHTFDTFKDAIAYQKEKHIEQNCQRNPVSEDELKCIHIYQYKEPKYQCSFNEFIDHIVEDAKEI